MDQQWKTSSNHKHSDHIMTAYYDMMSWNVYQDIAVFHKVLPKSGKVLKRSIDCNIMYFGLLWFMLCGRKGGSIKISYKKLWMLMIEKDITKH